MSFVSFIDSSQNRFVDSEAHGGSDKGERQVSNDTDEGDISDGQETHQHGSADDAGVPGVLPVEQGVHPVIGGPHCVGAATRGHNDD